MEKFIPYKVLKCIKTLTLFKIQQVNRQAADKRPERRVKRKAKVMIKHWTEYWQHNNLTIPAPDFVQEMTVVYELLEAFHGRDFHGGPLVIVRFVELVRPRVEKFVPVEVLKFFIKTLTLFKVKHVKRQATERQSERTVKRKSKVIKTKLIQYLTRLTMQLPCHQIFSVSSI